MTANKLRREPLWAILLAALVAAMVSLFVFVQGGAAAPAADGKYSPYVINGEPVPNGKYPFMSFLLITSADGSDADNRPDVNQCGGSLIDKTHVLTAGHCVFQRGPQAPPPQKPEITLTVGRTGLNSDQGQVRNVKDIDVHPLFKALKYAGTVDFRYDVAVLTLSRAVKGIKPIELATSSQNNLERPGRHATLAGWGSTVARTACEQPRGLPDRMQEAQLPIVSDSRAEKILRQAQPPACDPQSPSTDFVPRLMIAAGAGKDSCKGDSGGPLFVRTSGNDGNNSTNDDDENGGKYTQIGITSWGVGCGAVGGPSVFTEVNAEPIASFIERTADNGDGDNGDGDDNNGDDK
jgi:secreted trypsin-like serine protease